ncbi:MAG: aminopeptidase P N-terminal domain-containing protein, partial [Myxococcota bacterium]|nr:aminopeptidase P N-terminal domain-containing protein [Myxococcota bacterium]
MPTPDALLRHADHRSRFLAALGCDAALLFSPPEKLRNGDAEYRYRQSSDVLWLTGWEQPECAVLLRPGAAEPFIMFVQKKDKEREVWTGRRPGPEGAVAVYGADAAYEFEELAGRLPELLQGYQQLHYAVAEDAARDRLVVRALAAARRKARRNGLAVPDAFIDPGRVLHDLRLIKSEAELALLARAADITAAAHLRAMAITAPGVPEYALEAEISHVFRSRGGSGPGYTTIVGGGANATILHYIENDAPLKDGDLVCVDAGCEFEWYTADVTRTWPVNGRFTSAQ